MNPLDDPLTAIVSAYASVFEDLAAATTGRTRRGPQGTVLAISGAPIAQRRPRLSRRGRRKREGAAESGVVEFWFVCSLRCVMWAPGVVSRVVV